jgi:hypothetical protein
MTRSTPSGSAGGVYQLKITIRGIEPAIWRRILVRDAMTLAQLHRVIKESFGWQNYHLYTFSVRDQQYEAPDEEATGKSAAKAKLKDLGLEVGDSFEYVYDFGDDWQHEIIVEDRTRPVSDVVYPVCTDGARAGPREDSGGADGYMDLIRVLQSPEDPDFAEMSAWAGNDFDPERFDRRAINRILMLAFGRGAV